MNFRSAMLVALAVHGPLMQSALPAQQMSYPTLVLAVDSPSTDGSSPAVAPPLPANLGFPAAYRALMSDVWLRSRTFRRQSARIGAERLLRVRFSMGSPAAGSHRRAATFVDRLPAGVIHADVHVAKRIYATELVEIVAHELEHIIEQLDGVELGPTSRRAPSTVWPTAGDAFETERAIQAGRTVAAEYAARAR